MESSDDSFAWSDASDCSTSDGSFDKGTMSESESYKKYKKKLHKKLFEEANEAEVKRELLNGKVEREFEREEPDSPTTTAPIAASCKRKHECSSPSESKPDLQLFRKHLKRERSASHTHNDTDYDKSNDTKCKNDSSREFGNSSDSSKTVKKKKSKRKSENLSIINEKTDMVIEEKFEAEESFVTPRPVNRLSNECESKWERISSQESEPELQLLEKHVKREQSAFHTHNDTDHEESSDHIKSNIDSSQEFQEVLNSTKNIKKKKSKRKSENLTDDKTDMVIEEKFEAEESLVTSRPENRLSNVHVQETEHVIDTETAHKSKKAKKKKQKEHSRNSQIDSDLVDLEKVDYNGCLSNVEEDVMDNESTEQTNTSALHQTGTKICDRIQFEDEDKLETENIESADSHSSKLRRFLKNNLHLEAVIKKKQNRAALSQDEDIWLLNCPREIDIGSLKGVDISLDSKCKLKTNNQTYISNIQNENSTIPIFTYEHKKPVVKIFVINGIVNFRKRIPKAHYVSDNVIQNQSNFIPLPETKNRHPLFGLDYKKAIKIPSAVKARLNHSSVSEKSASVDKKRKKKNEMKQESFDYSSPIEREEEVDGGGQKDGGGRKRRLTTLVDTQPATKKKKKASKQEIYVGSWDSEKAIEDNLFNF